LGIDTSAFLHSLYTVMIFSVTKAPTMRDIRRRWRYAGPELRALAAARPGRAGFVQMGVFLGYRPCCVSFFATVWLDAVHMIKKPTWLAAHKAAMGPRRDGYIPCPACAREFARDDAATDLFEDAVKLHRPVVLKGLVGGTFTAQQLANGARRL
jgi:hypothetical protein